MGPPRERRPEIILGWAPGSEGQKQPVGFTLDELESHVIIVGGSGFGKTLAAKKLCIEFSIRRLSCIVFDVKGEYSRLPGASVLRPGQGLCLSPPGIHEMSGVELSHYSMFAADLLTYIASRGEARGDAATLSPSMESMLFDSVENVISRGDPLHRVLDEIERVPGSPLTRTALKVRLRLLAMEPLRSALSCKGRISLGSPGITVIDVSSVWRYSQRQTIIAFGLFASMLRLEAARRVAPGRAKPDTLVVVDETPTVAPRGSPTEAMLAELARTVRAGRVSLGLVSQTYKGLRGDVRSSVGSIVAFGIADSAEARVVAESLGHGVGHEEVQGLRKLHFIMGGSGLDAIYKGVLDRDAVVAAEGSSYLEAVKRRLLESIHEKPCLPARDRRALLGANGYFYRLAVNDLVREGKIRVVTLKGGWGRPIVLYEPLPPRRPGVLHRCASERLAEILRERLEGAEVMTEYLDADIAVKRGSSLVAIEVETGSNIARGKYLALLDNGFKSIVIVVLDKSLTKTTESASKGLPALVIDYGSALARLPGIVSNLLKGED